MAKHPATDKQMRGLARLLVQQRQAAKAAKDEADSLTKKIKERLAVVGEKYTNESGVAHTRYVCRDGTELDVAHTTKEKFMAGKAVEVLEEYEGGEEYLVTTTTKDLFEEALLAEIIPPETVADVIELSYVDAVYIKESKD